MFVCAIQYARFECVVSNNDGDKNPTYECHNVIECTFIGFESQNASQFGIDSKCLLIVRFFIVKYASIIGDVKCIWYAQQVLYFE